MPQLLPALLLFCYIGPYPQTVKRVIIIVCFLAAGKSAFAQSRVIDSLQRIVDLQRRDTIEVISLLNLTNEYLRRDFNKSMVMAHRAKSLSQSISFPSGISGSYGYLVTLHQGSGKPDSALYYLSEHERLAKQYAHLWKVVTNYNQSAGLLYKNRGEYKKALPYLVANLSLLKIENESKAGLLLNIGNTYTAMSDYRNAMTYHLQSLALFEKLGNKRGQSFCLHGLGNDYFFLEQFKEAKHYLTLSLKMKKALEDKRGVVTTLGGLGNIEKEVGNYALAEKYYKESLQGARELKLIQDEVIALNQLGLNYSEQGDNIHARESFLEGLKLARQQGDSSTVARLKSALVGLDLAERKSKQSEATLISNLNTFIQSGDRDGLALEYGRLSDYYAMNKQYDKAFQYLQKHEALKDSVEGNLVLLQMKTLEEQYNSEKKQREIELLKKDQELHEVELGRQRANTLIMIVALISVVIISILLVNRYRISSRARRLMEMERIRNTIARDLHDDIGSTLSSINIISQLALKDANGSATHFQRIAQHSTSMMESMSDIVWSINPNNDSLEQVISKMKEFTSEILEPLDVSYSFSGEENLYAVTLNPAFRKNLFLIFKEAINNAAKYSAANNITIHFRKKDTTLFLTITDNGKGFDQGNASSGNGLRNMKARAQNINGDLSITSSPKLGTEVVLSLPIT